MRTSNLLLKLNPSMNSAARRTMWRVSLSLLFLALIVCVPSQPMQASRSGFITGAALGSWSANKAATGGDIAQSNTCLLPPSGLVSWWPADGNASDIVDGNQGALQNGGTFAAGMVGHAFSLDGIDDFVSVPHSASLNPSQITVDAWIYATDINGQSIPPIVKKAGEGLGQVHGYALEINNNIDGAVRFWVFISGGWYNASSVSALSTNTWYHVAGTYDGSEIKLYLNGQLRGSTSAAGIFEPSLNPLHIGADPANPNRFFEGLIDEVGIFSRALTVEEIRAMYLAGSAGKCKPLQYYPLPFPVRLFDTRPGENACFAPGVPLGDDAVRIQPATGTCLGATIPPTAKAIVGNATVVNFVSTGSHWITLYPSDAPQPNASNLNFTDNQIVPNNFTVGLGQDGAFKIYSHAATHFIVDITGYYAPPGQGGLYYHPLTSPVRLLDTRPGETACDAPGAPLADNGTRAVTAHGTCSGATIPSSAKAIVGNATVVNFISSGFHWITLYPFGASQPNASNLNFTANQIVPNAFVVGLSNDGKFNIYSHAATHFIVDVTGYFSDEPVDANGQGLLYTTLPSPVRLLDTRPGEAGCDAPGAPLGDDATRVQTAHRTCFGVTIPSSAKAVAGNATVVNFISSGFHWITLYPFGAPQPNASNLNFTANQIVPNAFVVGLSNDGKFNVYSHAGTHFIIDLTGYFAP